MPYESSEDPVGLPLDPLGSWIGIKDQLADLSRPIRPCLFYTLDECIWPMKKQLSTLPNFPRKIPHATYCQKSWKGWRTLKYWSYKKSMWDVFLWRTSNFYVKSSAGISWIGIRTRWSVTFGRSSAVMFETTFTKHHFLFVRPGKSKATGSTTNPRGRGESCVSWVEPAVISRAIVPLATWRQFQILKWNFSHVCWDAGKRMSTRAASIVVHLKRKDCWEWDEEKTKTEITSAKNFNIEHANIFM